MSNRRPANTSSAIDPRTNPFFRPQEAGDGMVSLGSGNGAGVLSGLSGLPGSEQFMMDGGGINPDALQAYLSSNGLQLMAEGDGDAERRWVQDAAGNMVVQPERFEYADRNWDAALALTLGVTGANLGAFGGAGGASGSTSAAPATAGTTATTTAAGAAPATAGAAGSGMTAPAGFSLAPSLGASAAPAAGTTATMAGATGMTAGNWLQLANLGAGLYASNQAGDRADAALAGANAAAEGTLGLSRDQFDWFKQFVQEQKPARDAAEKRAQDVSDAQLEAMRFATGQARELDAYNRSTFRPIEQRLASEAAAYDTPERRSAAAASAAADVDMSAAAAQAGNDRALARSGVAPGSMRAMALREDGAAGQAAARGGAMTRAVRDVEGQGYARMMDAAGLGRGVVSNQATQQQIASATGNSSVGNSMQSLQPSNMTAGNMQTAFGNSFQANQIAGNLFSQAQRAANDETGLILSGMSGIGRWIGSNTGTGP